MKLKNALLATALLAVSATAGAAEFWTYVPNPGFGELQRTGGTASVTANVTGFNGGASQFSGNFWAGGGTAPTDSFFRFFCIELTEGIGGGAQPYFGSTFDDADLAKLFDVAFPNKEAGDFWKNGFATNFGSFGSAVLAAAFQVAVWEIYLDDGLSLDGGALAWTSGDAAVKAAADNMLALVANYGQGTGYTKWTLYKFVSPVPGCTAGVDCTGYQNFVSATYAVPEPGSLALFGFALAGLGLVTRRRRD